MESTQFYVWLPSNSSIDVFPSNTLAEFRVHLPQSIQLTGDWEVALTEIQYPHSWNNVREIHLQNHFYVGKIDEMPTVCTLPAGHYSSLKSIIDKLNGIIKATKFKDKVEFSYEELNRKVTAHVEKGYRVFCGHIRTMLGFNTEDYITKTTTAEHEADLDLGFHSLYIYCDVVQPQVVGDTQVPLIRIIPVEGKDGERVSKAFQSPQYLPVSRKQFETIEVNIRQDTGAKVPFETGRVLVTLHFRRASPFFN